MSNRLTPEEKAAYDAAAAKHGADRVHPVSVFEEFFILRTPTRDEMQRFRSYMLDDKRQAEAHDVLMSDCVVFPERAAADAIFDRKPGLPQTLGVWLTAQTGIGQLVEKKLP